MNPPLRTPIAICADDFALAPEIDAAVIALAKQHRLSATSCMTDAPRWRQAAAALAPLRGTLDVGVHLNLTEGYGGPAASLPQQLVACWLRRHDRQQLAQTIARQLDAFEDQLGAPDFIDGHQHLHQFPQVRELLLDAWTRRYAEPKPWIRNTLPARSDWRGKPALLARLGGATLAQQLRAAGAATNAGFAGVYGFDAATVEAFGGRFAQWLAAAKPGMLMMCHPAIAPVAGDAIGNARALEYRYLASDACGAALEAAGVQVVRLTAWLAQPR